MRVSAALVLLALAGCVSRPPTISHVHIGHALTGVHVTPEHKGYVVVAEQRAGEALAAANAAAQADDLGQVKMHVAAVLAADDASENFGLKQSLLLASNHISFAATSPDASANVIAAAPVFAGDIRVVIARCDYIDLLGKDVLAARSQTEAVILAHEILKLAQANVQGAPTDGAMPETAGAALGATPPAYGMVQLHAELDAMVARERPAYRTVDRWYLFNLVRLPNGRWVFDRLGRGGNIDGYK